MCICIDPLNNPSLSSPSCRCRLFRIEWTTLTPKKLRLMPQQFFGVQAWQQTVSSTAWKWIHIRQTMHMKLLNSPNNLLPSTTFSTIILRQFKLQTRVFIAFSGLTIRMVFTHSWSINSVNSVNGMDMVGKKWMLKLWEIT